MNELMKIVAQTIGTDSVQTVNARELHAFLEVGKDFSTWIKDRIEQYDFQENQDFVCSPILGSEGRGGHNRKDYHLTLDMAKELAMVERNEKGKQARQYFLECERAAKAKPVTDPMHVLNDPAAMRGLLLTYSEKVIKLEADNAAMAPKVDALDRLATANGSVCLTDAAKTLQVKPKMLIGLMSANHWIYKRVGCNHWCAYQERLQQGVLEHKVTTVDREDGTEKIVEQVRVTPKGLTKLAQLVA